MTLMPVFLSSLAVDSFVIAAKKLNAAVERTSRREKFESPLPINNRAT
jgi:hypothetical protein